MAFVQCALFQTRVCRDAWTNVNGSACNKQGKREILRNGREDGCSDERIKGEGKKEQKNTKTEVLEMLSRKHRLLLLSDLIC